MISAAMLDYQDMPVTAERPGENDSPVMRRHDPRTVPGLEGYSLGRAAESGVFAETCRDPALRRHRNRALAREGAQESRLGLRRRGQAQLLFRCRSEEHTSELQSLMRISYAVFCLKKKKKTHTTNRKQTQQSTKRNIY